LLLDEPTVGVDPQSRNAIFDFIRELNAQGLSLLYTTHYMEEAELLCDRVGIMDQGQIIALDTPQNLIHSLGTGIIHIGVPSELQTGRSEAPDGSDGGLMADLRALSQVKEVAQRDGTLVIESHDAKRALLDVIGLFNERDTPMTALNILEPNLESVFIQLTGKQLRD
jgi:ABC-2 type transport system ATP-binding protein